MPNKYIKSLVVMFQMPAISVTKSKCADLTTRRTVFAAYELTHSTCEGITCNECPFNTHKESLKLVKTIIENNR